MAPGHKLALSAADTKDEWGPDQFKAKVSSEVHVRGAHHVIYQSKHNTWWLTSKLEMLTLTNIILHSMNVKLYSL